MKSRFANLLPAVSTTNAHFSNSIQVVDGRPKGRYDGTAPEPNPRINSGHMIGSTNLPFMELTNKETMTLKSPADIRKGKWILVS